MTSLQELLAQKEALDREIERARQQERAAAIEQVRTLMARYGLSASDVALHDAPKGRTKPKAGAGRKVAAKYRNASTGETWSGRGLQPRWLKAALASGKKLSDFAV